MSVLLKRWLRASRAARIAVGLIYLVVTLTMPLCHTCGLGEAHRQTCNCGDGCHYSCCEISSCEQLSVSSKHTERKAGSRSNHGLCMACMYSITSNATRANIAAPALRNEALTFAQSLPSASIVKRSEWFSSVSLRAPPNSIS